MDNINGLNDENSSADKSKKTNKEEMFASSVTKNVQVTLSNEYAFKIVIILITCLKKLRHTGNFNCIK